MRSPSSWLVLAVISKQRSIAAMTLPRKCVSLLLIYCFAVAVAPHPNLRAANTPTLKQETSDEDEGLRFRLSEGAEQPEVHPVTNVAPATSLSTAETEAVLKRLPPIKSETTDETDFALRARSLPAPRTGVTVMQPFPAANELAPPVSTSAGALEVVRYS